MATHVRQLQGSLRVCGHIRPRDPAVPTPLPSRTTANTISTALPEFRTSYFFDGPELPESQHPPTPTPSPKPAPLELTRTLFDGPSRPRYMIPLAELYLGEIKKNRPPGVQGREPVLEGKASTTAAKITLGEVLSACSDLSRPGFASVEAGATR
ncbi:hypothetical protein GLOTRDRAFT_140755 [Gloeophyllum trabeum ATCC 11539]|uniref:Uncharacterized protein n=1 Tax=Gloeophyllum trabeum (strain ATCC 11539 / FP-39264 / Madison 617) TaxID=670483 RepID=S7RBX2_GLOTA|nr:uncharacterized protein GLOTRDRAFT_140755 [Gloeophyllum trabeum ATCC 11539]EPQ51750.1 hypothetical protein GLOTRDRAFT_140755 [Gloeophyllum trabeum ATCC 11539]